jgi:hypothetical protein
MLATMSKRSGLTRTQLVPDIRYKESLNLVSLQVQDLPLNGKPETRANIIAAAETLGLSKCPPEIAPRLRAQYTNQPNGEYLYMAMDTISDRGGRPGVFRVSHGGGELWLDRIWVDAHGTFLGGNRIVFVRK